LNHKFVYLSLFLFITVFPLSGCALFSDDTVFFNKSGGGTSKFYYVPKADGNKYTKAEIAALNSTDVIDVGLSRAAMDDVFAEYKRYIRGSRSTIDKFSASAERYLKHARNEFKKRGMPEELAYLAMIESGYNPAATSPAGAAGAWQFMPATGKMYGLKQNWWIDERRDPYKAVEAAAKYLDRLHKLFDDWKLAVASYNAGEGKIGRALKGTRTDDFFDLVDKNHRLSKRMQLRKETKDYIPRFIAFCKIMRNLESLGFEPIDIHSTVEVKAIVVKQGTDLQALSRAVGLSWSEFRAYNTAFKRHVSPTSHVSVVYVPKSKERRASLHLRKSRINNIGWKKHYVKRGDSWERVGRKYSVPVSILKVSNRNTGSLKAGRNIRIPGSDSFGHTPSFSSNKKKSYSKASSSKTRAVHVVRSGESLYRIASRYRVNIKRIMSYNRIRNANSIGAGQKIYIPR